MTIPFFLASRMSGRLLPLVLPGLAIVLLLLLTAEPALAAAGSPRPNILLILSDDHSYPHLGIYGRSDAITPNLDAVARQGMRFTRAYTTTPQCAPSRISIFAGRNPISLGVTRFTQPAGREHPFFTDALDFSRAITTKRYRLIFNALPDRAYVPVDMVGAEAWPALLKARAEGRLSALHERLIFQQPRPVFELFDLEKDPYELNNLAGREETKEILRKLRIELAKWMIREADFLPMPSRDYPDDTWRLRP